MQFTTTMLLAGLAAFASAQTSAVFTNSSSSATVASTSASASPSAALKPGSVAGWKYAGCAAPPSAAGFPGFALAETSAAMTVERCLADCGATAQFAGLVGGSCYCSAALSNGTTFVPDSSCSTPCPGNTAEGCGGPLLSSRRRQAAGSVLSLYQQTALVIPAGNIYVSVSVFVYVSICPTGFTTITYTGTVTATGCGCPTPVKPTIPVTVITTICTVCAATPTTVTLTVPVAVASTAVAVVTVAPVAPVATTTKAVTPAVTTKAVTPAVTTAPVVFKGAAANVQAGSAGLMGLLMAAVALF